jgi:AcrR family transcriptional regulator
MRRIYPNARDKILDATERVILRDGPHGASVDAILLESGMSKGGFFHHFPTKTALLLGLFDRLASAVAASAEQSVRDDTGAPAPSLRRQIRLAFDRPPRERECNRALVMALVVGVMESTEVAARARKANRRALATARAEGVDTGTALVIQLALDGYFLGESYKTTKLDGNERAALREALLGLLERKPQRVQRRAAQKGARP